MPNWRDFKNFYCLPIVINKIGYCFLLLINMLHFQMYVDMHLRTSKQTITVIKHRSYLSDKIDQIYFNLTEEWVDYIFKHLSIILYKFSELLSLGHIYTNIGKYKTNVIFLKIDQLELMRKGFGH